MAKYSQLAFVSRQQRLQATDWRSTRPLAAPRGSIARLIVGIVPASLKLIGRHIIGQSVADTAGPFTTDPKRSLLFRAPWSHLALDGCLAVVLSASAWLRYGWRIALGFACGPSALYLNWRRRTVPTVPPSPARRNPAREWCCVSCFATL